MSNCYICSNRFSHSDQEKVLLSKIGLPLPAECPECRLQRRLAFRNEQQLYHRKCDLSGKQIISIYAPDSPYKVYDQHEWHSDAWEALDYGRDYDFNRPFFEQMHELMLAVPKISVFATHNENSDFTNGSQQNKNCYMIFVSDHNQDCYYSYSIYSCVDCLECLNCYKCTLCLECLDSTECYNTSFSVRSHNCVDSAFLSDCRSCSDCILCCGLRSKRYHILNKAYSKKEYEAKAAQLKDGSRGALRDLQQEFLRLSENQQIHQYYNGQKNENVTGDHISNSRNCSACFDSSNLEDCAHLVFGYDSKDCLDAYVVVDNSELCYETISTISQYNTQFTYSSWRSKNSMYLDHCTSCSDCFACSGLRRKQYCIFNTQFSKEEYYALREQITAHMKATEEWGKAFPVTLSPFSYNETAAQEYYPLDKNSCSARGWAWRSAESSGSSYQGPRINLPDSIFEVEDSVVESIFSCESSAKLYKFTPQELKLYRMHKTPLPKTCFTKRHSARIQLRNPRWLWSRNCLKCGVEVETSFAPRRPEKIYCESCYLDAVN